MSFTKKQQGHEDIFSFRKGKPVPWHIGESTYAASLQAVLAASCKDTCAFQPSVSAAPLQLGSQDPLSDNASRKRGPEGRSDSGRSGGLTKASGIAGVVAKTLVSLETQTCRLNMQL